MLLEPLCVSIVLQVLTRLVLGLTRRHASHVQLARTLVWEQDHVLNAMVVHGLMFLVPRAASIVMQEPFLLSLEHRRVHFARNVIWVLGPQLPLLAVICAMLEHLLQLQGHLSVIVVMLVLGHQ
jgi:hypothetical protein